MTHTRFVRILLAVLVCLFCLGCHSTDSGNWSEVDAVFQAYDRSDSPGCILGIIRDGDLVYTRGYGMADIEQKRPITVDTVFRIASSSKQFTAACIQLLHVRGKIDLHDRLSEYIPGLTAQTGQLEIQNLIYHTSGLPDFQDVWTLRAITPEELDPGIYRTEEQLEAKETVLRLLDQGADLGDMNYLAGLGENERQAVQTVLLVKDEDGRTIPERNAEDLVHTEEEALETLKELDPLFPPGSEFEYNNSNYLLLAVIVRSVTGMSLREFAHESIFKPLGMDHTHFHDDNSIVVLNLATGYKPIEGGGFRISMPRSEIVGDGGLFTTVGDMAKWDGNFYNPVVGGPAFILWMTNVGMLNNGEPTDTYASGLFVHPTDKIPPFKNLLVVHHGGHYVGYRAQFIRIPEYHTTIICLGNLGSNDFDPEKLTLEVARIVLSGP